MKLIVSALTYCAFALICITCNSASSNDSGGCGGPTVSGCSGDPCAYTFIYDSKGNFIKEISSSMGESIRAYWDGTDCHGKKVGCGKYTVTQHIVYQGQSQSQTFSVMVKDSLTIVKNGSNACDSLKRSCSGNYSENISYGIDGDEGVECMCCK
jgi:hypothetical protein